MKRSAALLLVALAATSAGCGGAPSAPPTNGAVHLPAGGAPPADEDPAPAAARKGVAVVAVGTGDAVGKATRRLARVVYQLPALRPRAGEGMVQVLAGGVAPAGDAALAELAELRAALPTDPESAAAKALLEAIANKVDARALVLVSVADDARAAGRLVRLEETSGLLAVRVDAATFAAPAPTTDVPEYAWTGTDVAIAALLRSSEVGPRRDLSRPPTAPDAPDEPGNITSKPWFWVIVGGVAALGLTAVIVSQTVDTASGTVHVQGKVVP